MKEGKLRPLIEKYYPEYYSWNEYPVNECVPIRSNREEWGILGNMYPVSIVVEGVEFASSEQLFQMMKFADENIILALYGTRGMTPKMKAKRFENEGLRRADWGRIIVDCMKFCLQMKYDQSEEFRTMLHKTSGLNIVEDETSRKTSKNGKVRAADTWGVVRDGDIYVGSNLLGRLLMELRDNGKLVYHLPEDILDFVSVLKTNLYGHTVDAPIDP